MQGDSRLDCLIIGYNDLEFEPFAAKQKAMVDRSGAYYEIQTNSVLRHGKRVAYMDFLNELLTQATGEPHHFNVFEAPSLGVCYLVNFLKERGFQADFVNFFNHGKAQLETLLANPPRSIALTTTFYTDDDPIIEIVQFVRQYCPNTKIIVGGPHIYNRAADLDFDTLSYVFKNMGADIYIIDSQGELTLSQVVESLKQPETSATSGLASIPNLMFTLDRLSFQQTGRQIETNDMDTNGVNWKHFEPQDVTPLAYLRTARSCPFTCAFCQYPILAGSHDLNSVESIAHQLETLHAMGTTDLVFIDDTFNVPLPRFKQLLRMMIDRKFNFRWVSFLRCSNVDEAAIDLMQESGCVGVLLGIESGDQQILNNMNKSANLDRYRFGIRELNKRNILTYASLICGFPGETEESVRNTINFIEETRPTFFNVQLYYHDTRSPIHQRAEEFKIQGAGYSWEHHTMNWQEARDWSIYMYRNIHNSIFFSLYGMSLWGISYLISKGLSTEQIKAFGKGTRTLLFDSLADQEIDRTNLERQLIDIFRPEATGTEYERDHLPSDPGSVFDRQYWQTQLAHCTNKVALPIHAQDDMNSLVENQVSEVTLDADLTTHLQHLAVNHGTTRSTLLLALLKLLIFQLSKQDDLCIGLSISGKTIPVRTQLSPTMEFEDLLKAVIQSTDAALDHQDNAPDTQPNVQYGYNVQLDEQYRPELSLLAQEQQACLNLRLELSGQLTHANQAANYLNSLLHFARTVACATTVA